MLSYNAQSHFRFSPAYPFSYFVRGTLVPISVRLISLFSSVLSCFLYFCNTICSISLKLDFLFTPLLHFPFISSRRVINWNCENIVFEFVVIHFYGFLSTLVDFVSKSHRFYFCIENKLFVKMKQKSCFWCADCENIGMTKVRKYGEIIFSPSFLRFLSLFFLSFERGTLVFQELLNSTKTKVLLFRPEF